MINIFKAEKKLTIEKKKPWEKIKIKLRHLKNVCNTAKFYRSSTIPSMGRADIDMFTSYPVQSLTLESVLLFPVNADN